MRRAATLTEGSDLPLRLIDRTLVVGEELGQVPESTPMVPLAADLARQQRSLRLKPSTTATVVELDLRREAQLARSVLLHRLALLGIDWGERVDTGGRTTGTFKEAWQLEWYPELAVAVIEASLYGNTVVSATEARVAELAEQSTDLAALGRLIEQCLLADLPTALRSVVATLADRTARQHDTVALLGTVEPLARTCRYGDVRGVDVAGVAHVLATVVVRASVGLRAACASLDDDGAEAMRTAIEAAHRGVALMDDPALRTPGTGPWPRSRLTTESTGPCPGAPTGCSSTPARSTRRPPRRACRRRLSHAVPGPSRGIWLDGFLAGEALLLLHERELLAIVDEWLASVADEAFDDLLPLVRRTFSRYQPAERRQIGAHLTSLGSGRRARPEQSLDLDLERAAPAVEAVARLAWRRGGDRVTDRA